MAIIRRHLLAAAFGLAVAMPIAQSAWAEDTVGNVYPNMAAEQQTRVTLWDLITGHRSAPREVARNTAGPQIRTDAGSDSATAPAPAPQADPKHMYDYLSGSSYSGGQ